MAFVATTSKSVPTGDESALKCYMCISSQTNEQVRKFNISTWSRFLDFVLKWQSLSGEQHQIATNFVTKSCDDIPLPNLPLPHDGGYHNVCYSRFTDKQRVERCINRLKRNRPSPELMHPSTPAVHDDSEGSQPKKKRLPLSDYSTPPEQARSRNVLPDICLFCNKREKRRNCQRTQTRKMENLVMCSTIGAVKLQQAAKEKDDTGILLKIENKDSMAIEVKYHQSCYTNYTSTEDLVQETQLLKGEFVNTDSENTEDELDIEFKSSKQRVDQHSVRDSYMSSLAIRKAIQEVKTDIPWPPTKDDLKLENAEALVPHQLYNFLAWTVSASDEPNNESKVSCVDTESHRKILAISQDIMYLASKGKTQLPKHTSLALALRHLTGSAQLIGLMNGFGYCVPHSVALNIDSAISVKEMDHGTVHYLQI
ncbi:hypothetical protein BSL78_24948 [Apostichopus japonicus]|uniref:Uncharacterized protein n=1 Tax=Stichopus japonicus TaxID=307972 RepID=A0A2G8JR53_STIJA|nr:hypothetical protein BSL78_24948 [Apostichopus japonicus]